MSEAFVNGALPMRWEFDTLLNNLSAAATDLPAASGTYAAARADVCRAFDAQAARIAELEAELAEATKERAEEDAELAKWRAFAWENRCEVCGGEAFRPVIGHDYIHGDVYGPEEPCPAKCGELRLRFESIDAEMESVALALDEARGPVHRARIAREFLEEPCPVPHHHGLGLDCQEKRLARWEATAKGSVEP